MRGVYLCSLAILLVNPLISADPSCPNGTVNINDGRCYVFSSSVASWSDAKSACIAQGMELAYPRNAFENAFIYTLIPDQLSTHPWLGVWSDAAGKWYDIQNNSIHYTYWGPGQPNLANSCAQMKYTGSWLASACDQTADYICRSA